MISNSDILFISLLKISGFGQVSLNRFVTYLIDKKFPFPKEDYMAFKKLFSEFLDFHNSQNKRKIPLISLDYSFQTSFQSLLESVRMIEQNNKINNIRMISVIDPEYPPLLKDIKNPPLILHCKGDISSLQRLPTVAVIGTREPSEFTLGKMPPILDELIDNGLTIVSGLAKGCDTLGHISAVSREKATIAVLAGGLHNIYPQENTMLAKKILDNKGLLISELPYGVNPDKYTFVLRDRIQSGLSYGIFVIETGIKGGTMKTVNYAYEQGRLIACSHYQIEDETAKNYEKFQGNIYLSENKKYLARKIYNQETLQHFINEIKYRNVLRSSNKVVYSTNQFLMYYKCLQKKKG